MSYSRTASGLYIPKSADRAYVQFGAVAFWAENGMVCTSAEQSDGSEDFHPVPPSEMRQRREGLIALARRKMELEGPSELRLKMFTDFVDGLERVIKKAEEQGPFEDLQSRRDRVRRMPTSVSASTTRKSKSKR